jgi:hypothetical protein
MSALPNTWLAAWPVVHADVNYLNSAGERPVSYTFEPPEGTPWTTGDLVATRVAIRDARPGVESGELSLDRSGFTKLRHRSALDDFSDGEAIRAIYYPESEALIRNATGAEKVVVFDHTLRDSEKGSRATSALREPVRRVHNDQTATSGPRRVRDHLPADEADVRLRQRFAIINLWRPLARVEQFPLALCDARSIEPKDLVPSDLVYRDKTGETYSFLPNPEHRWYWFPRLEADEPLLLKIYDSIETGVARLTAHTAFELPDGGRAPRRSIELRALVFWPPHG